MSRLTRAITGRQSLTVATEFIEDYFCSGTYQGNGSGQAISTSNGDSHAVDLQNNEGMIWIKGRSYGTHSYIYSTVRGVNKFLKANGNQVEDTNGNGAQGVSAFGTNSFTIGSGGSSFIDINNINSTFDYWVFRSKPRFFDIVTYTGNSTTNKVSHNLQCEPGYIMIKNLNTNRNWASYHRSQGNQKWQEFNTANAFDGGDGTMWIGTQVFDADYGTAPNSTHFHVGATNSGNNANGDAGDTYIAFLFAHDESPNSFINCGQYSGGTDGTKVTLGWEPKFLMVKNATGSGGQYDADDGRWFSFNDQRPTGGGGFAPPYINHNTQGIMSGTSGSNGSANYVKMNDSDSTNSNRVGIQAMPDGFQMVNYSGIAAANKTHSTWNNSGDDFTYIAIRQTPMDTPSTNTEVYAGFLGDQRADNPRAPAGFAPDIAIMNNPNASSQNRYFSLSRRMDRKALIANWDADVELSPRSSGNWDFFSTGFYSGTLLSSYFNYVNMIREFPKVAHSGYYIGDGTALQHIPHNLGVEPEMIWVNTYESSDHTGVLIYCKHATPNPETRYGYSWSNSEFGTAYSPWADLYPNKNTFSVKQESGNAGGINRDGAIYQYTMFATFPNISKVGSYSGSASLQNIDCGFSSSARFVMIRNYLNDASSAADKGSWLLFDTTRGISNYGNDTYDNMSATDSIQTSQNVIDTYNSGFAIVGNDGSIRTSETGSSHNITNDMNDGDSDSKYIFLAFR